MVFWGLHLLITKQLNEIDGTRGGQELEIERGSADLSVKRFQSALAYSLSSRNFLRIKKQLISDACERQLQANE